MQSQRSNSDWGPPFATYKSKVGTITTLLWEDDTSRSNVCGKDIEDREIVIRFNHLTTQPLEHVLRKQEPDGRWRFQATVLLNTHMKMEFEVYQHFLLVERGNENRRPSMWKRFSPALDLISKELKVNKLELPGEICLDFHEG